MTPHQKHGESVLVHNQSYLTLKVEGIVNYSNQQSAYQKVRRVCISLNSRKQVSSSGTSTSTASSQHDSLSSGKVSKELYSNDFQDMMIIAKGVLKYFVKWQSGLGGYMGVALLKLFKGCCLEIPVGNCILKMLFMKTLQFASIRLQAFYLTAVDKTFLRKLCYHILSQPQVSI